MIYTVTLAFVFGLVLGSFANVCIWRIPRSSSIVRPSSFCPKCMKPIKWYHNVPVVSYIFLRGRCAYCSRSISLRYPLVEIATAILTAGWFLRFESLPTAFIFTFLGLALVIITGVDIDYRIIPPQVSYPLMAAGLVLSFFNPFINGSPPILYSAAGLTLGALILLFVRLIGTIAFKKEAMGLGDVKLMMGIGSFTGPQGVLWALFLGSVIGSVAGLGLRLSGRLKKYGYIPFGPFLATGAVVYILFSDFFRSFLL